jgi:hypothetical protein
VLPQTKHALAVGLEDMQLELGRLIAQDVQQARTRQVAALNPQRRVQECVTRVHTLFRVLHSVSYVLLDLSLLELVMAAVLDVFQAHFPQLWESIPVAIVFYVNRVNFQSLGRLQRVHCAIQVLILLHMEQGPCQAACGVMQGHTQQLKQQQILQPVLSVLLAPIFGQLALDLNTT